MVGSRSLKTDILLAANCDPIQREVTFQAFIYLSVFVTSFLRIFPPHFLFTFPAEKSPPEMSPLPPTCSLEIYMHLASQILLIFYNQGGTSVKKAVDDMADFFLMLLKIRGSIKLVEEYSSNARLCYWIFTYVQGEHTSFL